MFVVYTILVGTLLSMCDTCKDRLDLNIQSVNKEYSLRIHVKSLWHNNKAMAIITG